MLVVRLNVLIAVALIAVGALVAAMSCAGDVCLGGNVARLIVWPTLGVLVGLGIRGLYGRSSLLAVVDAALAAIVVGLSSRTILQSTSAGCFRSRRSLACRWSPACGRRRKPHVDGSG